ncbi:LuxR family transcriptional regulator [Bradyrhizobium sp. LTSPM299]|uniref:response regulator transcription factor n=1 Tax=Bradyrhizobium sp. LTSPM299 TaxID=1619233 RepID=UPI0005CA8181|nr:response regulator transcription factor [Bradyrhizobium sp. LTSPM299]KJC60324.1 LuxR family transcriptional regulator [Bradyrhizobium sp. LTSPM299]
MTNVDTGVDANPKEQSPLVLVVDDDQEVREALSELFLSVGFEAQAFASTREVLEQMPPDRPACLVLDVRLPGSSGLDLQNQLRADGCAIPIVFLTAFGDVPMTVQAMKAGATDFLIKPVRDQTLLDAVAAAIDGDIVRRAENAKVQKGISLLKALTSREKQVLNLVVNGKLNKQIAYELGISEITVKLHRSNAMKKMGTSSVAHLVRVWETLPSEMRTAET